MEVRDIFVRATARPAPYAGPGVCLACLRADGCFEMVGPAWTKELGFSAIELEGRRLIRLVALDADQAQALLRRMVDRREPDPFTLPLRRKHGGTAELELFRRFDDYESTLYFAGGNPAAGLTSQRDLARGDRARS